MDEKQGIMDLRQELEQLEDNKLAYVLARSKTTSVKKACKDADISTSTFYAWEEHDRLDELANLMKVDRAIEVEMRLRDALPDAVQTIIDGLNERRYDTKFKAAVEILDRTLGKSTQKQEINAKVDGEVVVNLSWDNDE
jgi:hypothetical protein